MVFFLAHAIRNFAAQKIQAAARGRIARAPQSGAGKHALEKKHRCRFLLTVKMMFSNVQPVSFYMVDLEAVFLKYCRYGKGTGATQREVSRGVCILSRLSVAL